MPIDEEVVKIIYQTNVLLPQPGVGIGYTSDQLYKDDHVQHLRSQRTSKICPASHTTRSLLCVLLNLYQDRDKRGTSLAHQRSPPPTLQLPTLQLHLRRDVLVEVFTRAPYWRGGPAALAAACRSAQCGACCRGWRPRWSQNARTPTHRGRLAA